MKCNLVVIQGFAEFTLEWILGDSRDAKNSEFFFGTKDLLSLLFTGAPVLKGAAHRPLRGEL